MPLELKYIIDTSKLPSLSTLLKALYSSKHSYTNNPIDKTAKQSAVRKTLKSSKLDPLKNLAIIQRK